MKQTLYLLDAYALIYRAYYAFIRSPRRDRNGRDTSAIFGFVLTLQDLLEKEQPDLIGVVFDPPGDTFRHREYENYKATREETPEGIKIAVPIIKDILKAYRIPAIEVPDFEADDVIGTLSRQADLAGYIVRMVTPDKDFGQLVTSNVMMLRPSQRGGFELWGEREVAEKMNLDSSSQVIDYLSLMGDASDNIPGCRGIGEKTASKLLREWGTVDNIYTHLSEIKGAMGKKLADGRDDVMLSRHLATIRLDVPIVFDPDKLKHEPIDKEALAELFADLDFRSLNKRILGSETSTPKDSAAEPVIPSVNVDLFGDPLLEAPRNKSAANNETNKATKAGADEAPAMLFPIDKQLQTLADVQHYYRTADTEETRKKLWQELQAAKAFAFDTETNGLDPLTAEIVGASFSIGHGEAWYLPLAQDKDAAKELLAPLAQLLLDKTKLKIGQNLKYDLQMLASYGIQAEGPYFDTMIAHYLLEPDGRHGLDYLAEVLLDYQTIKYEDMIGSATTHGDIRSVPHDLLRDYAAEDADVTWRLYEQLGPRLVEDSQQALFDGVEMPLIPVLTQMEREGVRVDPQVLGEIAEGMAERVNEMEQRIHEMAGLTFNVNSPKQVGEVLFDKLQLMEKPKKTKTGVYSTSEDVLVKIKRKHAIIPLILDYRTTRKLLNTYIEPLPGLISPIDGRIHTSYNQVVTATGRLSSSNPNLQNIPIRTPEGREIRRAFVPRSEAYTFLSADYSQIELRLMAHFSADEALLDAFRQGEDIHTATAAKIYGLPLADVSDDQRRSAKTANFGIIYGISAFGLAERLDISRTEAKELIDGYFEHYPGVKQYMDNVILSAQKNGYVSTLMGRRRYLPEINSRNATVRGYAERNAINAPLQGSAADIIKVAMIRIAQQIEKRGLRSRMILQVHDELNFDAHLDEVDELRQIVKYEMENAIKLETPLVAEIGTGANWLEAH